jgi:cytochrome c oxidase assembly factor CtaG
MMFSPVPWYRAYDATVVAWGLTPLEDQTLAGLAMWIPGTLVYTMAGLTLLALCLRESEQRLRRAER